MRARLFAHPGFVVGAVIVGATVTVTNYNKRCKTQTTSAFNNFSNTVDTNNAFFEFFYFFVSSHFSVYPFP